MSGAGTGSLRERVDVVDLETLCVMAAVLVVTADGIESAIVSVAALAVAVPAVRWALEAADVGEAGARGLLGALVAGLGAVAFATGGSAAVGAGVVAVGCWLVLDSIYASRYGDSTTDGDDDISEAEMYTLMEHSRWVAEALREADRPLGRAELRERTGLTEDELDDVLEIVRDNGTLERRGTGYVVDESELGGVAFVRGIVRTVGGRLVRPFRLFRPSR